MAIPDAVQLNSLIARLIHMTRDVGRDWRSHEEFPLRSSQVVMDTLRECIDPARQARDAALAAALPHLGGESEGPFLKLFDGFVQEISDCRAEIDKLKAQLAEAKAGNQNVQRHYVSDVADLWREQDTLNAEISRLTAELEAARAETERVSYNWRALSTCNDRLEAEGTSLKASNIVTEKQLEAAKTYEAMTSRQLDLLERQFALTAKQLEDVGRERDGLKEDLHYCNGTCDLAMKRSDEAEAENTRLKAALKVKDEALEPFAVAAEMFAWPVFEPDTHSVADGTRLIVADLRRARAARAMPVGS